MENGKLIPIGVIKGEFSIEPVNQISKLLIERTSLKGYSYIPFGKLRVKDGCLLSQNDGLSGAGQSANALRTFRKLDGGLLLPSIHVGNGRFDQAHGGAP